METKCNYFIIFDTTEGAYLSLDRTNNGLLTYSALHHARNAFELHYKNCHEQQSVTWSASAAIHWLSLKPFAIALSVSLTPMDVLIALTNSDTPDLKVYSLSSIAVSRVRGVKVDLNACRRYEVSHVDLINSKWWQEESA